MAHTRAIEMQFIQWKMDRPWAIVCIMLPDEVTTAHGFDIMKIRFDVPRFRI
jgi:hypothetical protein